MANPTTTFGWVLAIENTGTNWDNTTNNAFESIDSDLTIVKATADAAAARAGAVFTGENEFESTIYAQVDKGSVSGAQTLDLDGGAGDHFKATATGAVTWTIDNWPASGKVQYLRLDLTNGGAGAQTFPAAVTFDGGTQPSFQTSGIDIIILTSSDNGTAIHANVAVSHT